MSLSSCSLLLCYAIKLTEVKFPQAEDRKRKRSQEDEAPLPSTTTPSTTAPSQKRPRASPPRSTLENTIGEDTIGEDTIGENAAVGVSGKEINPVEYWTGIPLA